MKRTLVYASLLTGLCLSLAALTLTVTGCSTVQKALNIVNPSYSIRDVRPRVAIALPLSASSIDLEFDVGVDNPNDVALRLDRLDFDVLINDNPVVSRVISDQGIQIPARGVGNVHLRTRVGYDNIRNIWREVSDLINGNRARYQIRGNAYYNTPIGQMRFPVTVYSR
ncbi:MAG: LEA type 2 family protein [Acidobacteriota bacterium]